MEFIFSFKEFKIRVMFCCRGSPEGNAIISEFYSRIKTLYRFNCHYSGYSENDFWENVFWEMMSKEWRWFPSNSFWLLKRHWNLQFFNQRIPIPYLHDHPFDKNLMFPPDIGYNLYPWVIFFCRRVLSTLVVLLYVP